MKQLSSLAVKSQMTRNTKTPGMKLTHSFFLSLIFVSSLFSSCKTGHPVDKKEALNRLKILNSDIISFIHRSSEQPGLKALGFLIKQTSAPLPFRYDSSGVPGFSKGYLFEAARGIYSWDTASRSFQKLKDTSIILIRFPMPDQDQVQCKFFLYSYSTGKTRTRPSFPLDVRAALFMGDKKVISILHQAKIDESMIASVNTELKTDSAELSFSMSRNGGFSVKNGEIIARLLLQEGETVIINSELNCKIDYHPPVSYSVSYIRLKQTAFSTELKGTIDYASISPTSNQYDKEFNKFTRLELASSEDHGIIGNIVLSPVGNNGRYDYFIRFSDGSESRIADQLLVLQKLFKRSD